MDRRARRADLHRLCGALPELRSEHPVPAAGAQPEGQATRRISPETTGARSDRRDRVQVSAPRFPLHDLRPDSRSGDCAGQVRFHVFPGSEDPAFAAHVGGLHGAALYALELRLARTQSSLPGDVCFLRRGQCLGGQLLQRSSQVHRSMTFQLIGVNHHTAPLEVRERLAISEKRLPEAVQKLAEHPGVDEAMIVSTCNRVELLARCKNGGAALRGFIRDFFTADPGAFDKHLYEYKDHEAIRHVFRVTSSLDSMVVGEPQILGQMKEAYAVARALGTVNSQLDALVTRAF